MEENAEVNRILIAILLALGFVLATVSASICRGLAKPTESGPSQWAAIGFFSTLIPPAVLFAIGTETGAMLGFLAGLLPVGYLLVARKKVSDDVPFFGTDQGGRTLIFSCHVDEVVQSALYALLIYLLMTIFLWDLIYR